MSEESSSTPLRLKPKLKADAEGTANTPGDKAQGGQAPGSDEGSGVRLKLKPRASEDGAPPPPPSPSPAEPSPSMEPKVRLKPRLAANEEPQVVKEAPPPVFLPPAAEVPPEPALVGFKLKPKAVPDEPPPLPSVPPPGSVIAPPSSETSSETNPAQPPRMRVKPPPELVASFSGGTVSGLPTKPARTRSPVLTLLLVIVLLGGGGYYGYYGYTKFIASPSQPEPASPKPDEPASLPGRMVSKAQDAVAAQEGRIHDLEELQVGSPNGSPVAANDSGVMASMPAREEPPPPPAPEPSAAFTRFVTDMRISGVFQGDPPRALINGRTIRAGETIDLGLGIVFIGIDADRRLILMREPSGAVAAKKY